MLWATALKYLPSNFHGKRARRHKHGGRRRRRRNKAPLHRSWVAGKLESFRLEPPRPATGKGLGEPLGSAAIGGARAAPANPASLAKVRAGNQVSGESGPPRAGCCVLVRSAGVSWLREARRLLGAASRVYRRARGNKQARMSRPKWVLEAVRDLRFEF